MSGGLYRHRGKVNVCKISTHDNSTDMITKSVPIAICELRSYLVGILFNNNDLLKLNKRVFLM
jgi:hypothetical protein